MFFLEHGCQDRVHIAYKVLVTLFLSINLYEVFIDRDHDECMSCNSLIAGIQTRIGRFCACLEPNSYAKEAKIYQKRPNYNFSNAAK